MNIELCIGCFDAILGNKGKFILFFSLHFRDPPDERNDLYRSSPRRPIVLPRFVVVLSFSIILGLCSYKSSLNGRYTAPTAAPDRICAVRQ